MRLDGTKLFLTKEVDQETFDALPREHQRFIKILSLAKNGVTYPDLALILDVETVTSHQKMNFIVRFDPLIEQGLVIKDDSHLEQHSFLSSVA